MNRTDRLVAIVMYLQGRRLTRAEDLAAHFEVSVRTIYRDISALAESGVPLAGEPGVGYSLLKGYHLPPVMLTAEEAGALFVGAEMARQFTDRSLHAPLNAALLKLRAILPRERQDYIDQVSGKTVVVGRTSRPADTRDGDREWLLPLQEATVKRRVVRLRYRGRSQEFESEREVEPLGVVFYGELWYLVAWCRLRGDMRHFRLDRMLRVELAHETFEPRPEFSLARHLHDVANQDQMLPVRIWFADAALERARRESYVGLIEERTVQGGAVVGMATYSLRWLASWLLSFGADAEALEPEALRLHVRDLARASLERHAKVPQPQGVAS